MGRNGIAIGYRLLLVHMAQQMRQSQCGAERVEAEAIIDWPRTGHYPGTFAE